MKLSKITALLLASLTVLSAQESIQVGNISQDHTFEQVVSDKGVHLGGGWVANIDLRTGWLNYDYQNSPNNPSSVNKGHLDSQGFYVVPKISLTTPTIAGFAAKVTGIYTTDFGINNPDKETRTFVPNPADPKSFGILQEAYLRFDMNDNKVLVGRQELTTPMIDADDWYMQSNAFEVAHYTNTMLENNIFSVGYFYKMAGVWDSGAYEPDIAPKGGTDFYSMSQASFISQYDKDRADDSGVIYASYELDAKHHNLQVWDYYATDIYNILFAQYDFKDSVDSFTYNLGAQIIDWQEVGKMADSQSQTNVDYTIYSARFDGYFDNGFSFATGYSKYTDGEGQGATLGVWGGYPYFANGMIFHFFEAGTLQNAASYKGQLGYDILENLTVMYRMTYYGLDSDHSISSSGVGQKEMLLNGLRLSYGGSKGAYFTGTYEHVDLDFEPDTYALRLIGGYKF